MTTNFRLRSARSRIPGELFACALAASLLTGCQSSPVLTTEYISPRVTGRVLDATTHQPVANVRVRKILHENQVLDATVDQPPKGGQALQDMQSVTTRTDRNGNFTLECQRNMSVIRHGGWSSVTLGFQHTDYARFTTNFMLTAATLTPDGGPLVVTGDILLRPLSK
jgi:hypothetical protein